MDVRNTVVTDMFKENVLEPLVVKEQIIKSATEAACMILRVDDVMKPKQVQNAIRTTWRYGRYGRYGRAVWAVWAVWI